MRLPCASGLPPVKELFSIRTFPAQGCRIAHFMKRLIRAVLFTAAATATMPTGHAQTIRDQQTGWDPQGAAQYLDARIDLWFERATELKTGQAKTSCISCHTVVPYLLARPVLRKAMHVNEPTPHESRLLKEMAARVETYPEHESMSDAKHGGERATEAVLNAVVLARQDAFEKLGHPGALTRMAFQQLWETQSADGSWDWMNFGEEPDETADARYNGAALAAIAVGTTPGLLENHDVDSYVDKLRGYLNGRFSEQNLYRRTWMLLASSRLNGLLTGAQRESLKAELRARQNTDGGWSLYKLGPWRWSNSSAPYAPPGKPEVPLLEKSDGYGTGLVAFALRESGVPADDASLQRATEWLRTNQREVQVDQHTWKSWRTYSLNHDRQHGGARGGPWKDLLMSDTATAFAVLALGSAE
jgi:hypothetical protein